MNENDLIQLVEADCEDLERPLAPVAITRRPQCQAGMSSSTESGVCPYAFREASRASYSA
jgi:hypothetical protein